MSCCLRNTKLLCFNSIENSTLERALGQAQHCTLEPISRKFKVSEPEPGTDRPVGRRERSTLLVIIAALAKLARIDVAKPSSAAVAIESETVLMGTRVAARTIEEHLRRVPEALENKAED
jgi:hypothetical protein